MATLILKW